MKNERQKLLLIYLIFVICRALALVLQWPAYLTDWPLFSSNYFGASYLNPSLFDLFINSATIGMGLYLINKNVQTTQKYNVWALLLVTIIFCYQINELYVGSELGLDLSFNYNEPKNYFKLTAIAIYIMNAWLVGHIIWSIIDLEQAWPEYIKSLNSKIIIVALYCAIIAASIHQYHFNTANKSTQSTDNKSINNKYDLIPLLVNSLKNKNIDNKSSDFEEKVKAHFSAIANDFYFYADTDSTLAITDNKKYRNIPVVTKTGKYFLNIIPFESFKNFNSFQIVNDQSQQDQGYLSGYTPTLAFLFLILVFLGAIYQIIIYFKHQNDGFNTVLSRMQYYVSLYYFVPILILLFIIFQILKINHKKQYLTTQQNEINTLANQLQEIIQQPNWQRNTHKLKVFTLQTTTGFQIIDQNNSLIFSNLPKNTVSEDQQFLNKQLSENDALMLKYPIHIPSIFKTTYNETLQTLIISFALVYLILYGTSLYIIQKITVPIKLLRKALENLKLDSTENPGIIWPRQDEIGELAHEFNSLVHRISENKRSISQKEKQNAWQDIAKQLAHEIKNPLTPIKLTLQHLENTLDRPEPIDKSMLKRSITGVLSHIQGINNITDAFAKFAKMPMPQLSSLNLSQILQNIEGIYLAQNEVEFHTHLPTVSLILGDEKLLSQVINNVIINALQATQHTELKKVSVRCEAIKDSYFIEISDNGPGITDEIEAKIFLPNFSTKDEGSGIGLSLAKWAIENMEGEINYSPNLPTGAKFTIILPKYYSRYIAKS